MKFLRRLLPSANKQSGHPAVSLTLRPEPDSYGFLYGTALSSTGESIIVNVMPPRRHWKGDTPLNGYEPHATDWVVYADGEEIARVRNQDDAPDAVARALQLASSTAQPQPR